MRFWRIFDRRCNLLCGGILGDGGMLGYVGPKSIIKTRNRELYGLHSCPIKPT